MAIADTINSMKTNITNAYNAIQTKGGTIPTNKNLENLSTAINSISAGGSGGVESVSTVAALKAKVTAENVGKIYKFTGVSSGLKTNVLYEVTDGSGGGYDVLKLNELVSTDVNEYTITTNFANCGPDSYAMENMPLGGSIKVNIITYQDGCTLPDTITVTGCSYTWTLDSSSSGWVKLYNATGNITVTIIATAASKYGKVPTKEGLWNLFGDNNFRGAKNSSNVFDDIGFTSDFISNYEKMSGGATSCWTHFIEDLSKAGNIVKSASKDLTEKDFNNIKAMIERACSEVGFLTVKFATLSASEFMKDGYMTFKVEFGKNAYHLYLWLIPKEAYAPLD